MNNQVIDAFDEFVVHEEKYFGQYVKEIKNFHNLAVSFTYDMTESRLFISGFPFDEGTYRTGGRIGAENAPKSFRDFLQSEKLYVDKDFGKRLRIFDLGDIPKTKQPDEDDDEPQQIRARQLTLDEAHLYQRQRIGQIIDVNLYFSNRAVIFAIGGSNDQSYCNAQSLFDCYPDKKFGIINIDSQFGVSKIKQMSSVHSGSPFRLLLDNPHFKKSSSKFIEFASNGAQCSQEDYQYLQSKDAKIYWLEKDIRRYKKQYEDQNNQLTTQAGQLYSEVIQNLENEVDLIFVSFDLESINAKYCPGVANPSVIGGLSDEEALEILQVTAQSKKLVLLDMSEFNPAVEYKKTGRFVVNLFYHFAVSFSKSNS